MKTALWTRRRVLQSMGIAASAVPLTNVRALSKKEKQEALRYILKPGTDGRFTGIQVLVRDGETWQERQFLVKPHAATLLTDVVGGHVYVAQSVDPMMGWPAGSVEAYRIDLSSGLLTHRITQSLALSACRPTKIALSSSPNALIVAAEGGVFSLLPIHGDGELQPVTVARKELSLAGISQDEFASRFTQTSCQMIDSFRGDGCVML